MMISGLVLSRRRYWIKQESAGVEINKDNLKSHMLVDADTSWMILMLYYVSQLKFQEQKIKIIKEDGGYLKTQFII